MDYKKPNYAGFVAIAAGPLGGSLKSLQEALEILLEGACYNFQETVADKEWINFLEGRGYRSGIAYPISLFYR